MSVDFIFDLPIFAFFWTWWCKCVPFLTLSFCFWIVLKDPCFVTCNHILQEISVTLDPFQKMKTHILPNVILFDCQILGTIFTHNFLMANSCVKIWWTMVWFKFNSPAIIPTVSWRSDHTRAHTFSTLSPVYEVGGVPEQSSSSMDSGSSENALYHLNTCDLNQSMLPIGLFQFIESFSASFPRFDSKLDCASLLEITPFHFCDTHTKTGS